MGVGPLKGEGLELRMSVTLRIQNTNDLPIDLNEVSVQMDFQARPFATSFGDVGGGAARAIRISNHRSSGFCYDRFLFWLRSTRFYFHRPDFFQEARIFSLPDTARTTFFESYTHRSPINPKV